MAIVSQTKITILATVDMFDVPWRFFSVRSWVQRFRRKKVFLEMPEFPALVVHSVDTVADDAGVK